MIELQCLYLHKFSSKLVSIWDHIYVLHLLILVYAPDIQTVVSYICTYFELVLIKEVISKPFLEAQKLPCSRIWCNQKLYKKKYEFVRL